MRKQKLTEYVELDTTLVDLALTYLQARCKKVSAYTLFDTCRRIMSWVELKGKSDDKKIIFAPDKMYVHKKYIEKFHSQETI